MIASPETKTRLADATDAFLAMKVGLGRGDSQISELARAFGWLKEAALPNATCDDVGKAQLRQFRDDLTRVDGRLRGQKLAFKDRLTDDPNFQIVHATSARYWKSIQAFFSWCHAEGFVADDRAAGLKMEKPKGETVQSPEPFTAAELQRMFCAPLYAGYQSVKRPMSLGQCRYRGMHWWSGILLMFTGMRGGELAQLLPSDFMFDDPIPHVKVQLVDGDGEATKSAKNQSSIRDIPLAPKDPMLNWPNEAERLSSNRDPQAKTSLKFHPRLWTKHIQARPIQAIKSTFATDGGKLGHVPMWGASSSLPLLL